MANRTTCMFCLAQHSLELRFDKRARPYLCCTLCFTRAFICNLDAVRGLGIVPDLIDRALQARQDDAKFQQYFDGKVIAMIKEIKASGVTSSVERSADGIVRSATPRTVHDRRSSREEMRLSHEADTTRSRTHRQHRPRHAQVNLIPNSRPWFVENLAISTFQPAVESTMTST